MKCVVDDKTCNHKVLEVLIVEDPNHIQKFGFSGRYVVCKTHVDIHIKAFKLIKRISIDENKDLSEDERRNKSFEFKSRCPKCEKDLKGQPKWYFGFISESNGHRFATSTCDGCGRSTLMSLGIIKSADVSMASLSSML